MVDPRLLCSTCAGVHVTLDQTLVVGMCRLLESIMETVSVYLMKEKKKQEKRERLWKRNHPWSCDESMFVFALMWSVRQLTALAVILSDFIKNFIQDNTILEKRNL